MKKVCLQTKRKSCTWFDKVPCRNYTVIWLFRTKNVTYNPLEIRWDCYIRKIRRLECQNLIEENRVFQFQIYHCI